MAKHNEIGQLGETIAAKYLEKKGFRIIALNYRKKWGELDIVATKDRKLHIVEVKTVNRPLESLNTKDDYRPEDNMHPWKIQRLKRAISTFIASTYRGTYPDWQFDLACVYLDEIRKIAKVRYISNIIL